MPQRKVHRASCHVELRPLDQREFAATDPVAFGERVAVTRTGAGDPTFPASGEPPVAVRRQVRLQHVDVSSFKNEAQQKVMTAQEAREYMHYYGFVIFAIAWAIRRVRQMNSPKKRAAPPQSWPSQMSLPPAPWLREPPKLQGRSTSPTSTCEAGSPRTP